MSNILNFYTIAAFILGVFLAGMVRALFSRVTSKVSGG